MFLYYSYLCKKINMKDKITFEEFGSLSSKLEITSGKILEVVEVPKSSKLLQLTVEFGEDDVRSVVTNIKPLLGEDFKDMLLSKSFLFVTNLEPVKMMGVPSEAMIIPGELEKGLLINTNLGGVKLL